MRPVKCINIPFMYFLEKVVVCDIRREKYTAGNTTLIEYEIYLHQRLLKAIYDFGTYQHRSYNIFERRQLST